MMKRSPQALLIVWMFTVAAGCGGEETPPSDQAAATTTDRNASGGSVSVSGGSGSGPSNSIQCGQKICTASPMTVGFINACCADEATSTCGTTTKGGGCAAVAEADARCESVDLMGAVVLPGCCTADGQCGINASAISMPGCTDLATAAMRAEANGMSGLVPAPHACDVEMTEDGGI